MQTLHQIVRKQQVLGGLVQRILGQYFLIQSISFLRFDSQFTFRFQRSHEERQKLLLVFCVELGGVRVVDAQKLRPHLPMLQFFVLDLRQRLQSQICVCHIVHIDNFHHACGALVHGVSLA